MRFDVQKASLEIDETTPPPMDAKPHFATVTFAQSLPEQIGTPLLDYPPSPPVDTDEESPAIKTKKPFKVQYFKDEKSLQCESLPSFTPIQPPEVVTTTLVKFLGIIRQFSITRYTRYT